MVKSIWRDVQITAVALSERTEKMVLEEKYNVFGALERIVFRAIIEKGFYPHTRIQRGLDRLAESPEFIAIRDEEVQARGLVLEEVTARIPDLYNEVSRYTYGNDSIITVRASRYTANTRAALVIFLKLQSTSIHGLNWREDREDEKDEYRIYENGRYKL
ncbi:hypothetical protein HOY80DRAFT_992206 [Tuber brumale]|nr:hypothetical protein HOY80DRAFT_992206 [Tuber brumale]